MANVMGNNLSILVLCFFPDFFAFPENMLFGCFIVLVARRRHNSILRHGVIICFKQGEREDVITLYRQNYINVYFIFHFIHSIIKVDLMEQKFMELS